MAKNRKKSKKQSSPQLQDLSLAQLIQAAEASLRSGAPKAAVDGLRFAVRKHGFTPDLRRHLFHAHLSHAEQLKRQGRPADAEEAAELAGALAEDVAWLTEADLLAYLALSSGLTAFENYNRYVRGHRRVPEAETLLAGHLFRHRRWALADFLDPSVPLAQEAVLVREATVHMDAGAWETALERLRALPRKSAFAPVRILCRAMSSFYAENDADAVKALSMIPEHFPLSGVAARLKEVLSAPAASGTPMEAAPCLSALWEGPSVSRAEIRSLIDCLDRGDARESAKQMRRLARSASPKNPAPFLEMLLQAAWGAVLSHKIDPEDYRRMASKLLPTPRAESLHMRLMITLDFTPSDAAFYILRHLAADFPDPAERRIAHAGVLLHVVREVHRRGWWEGTRIGNIDPRCADVMGFGPESEADIPIEMTVRALTLDPDNRDGYLLLGELSRRSKEDRKKVEEAFLNMMRVFPEDPFPCLELASVYDESRAFRKAENILKEAMRRAPHDARVVDRHAVSLLVAAEKNIRRGRFHQAAIDIERAGMLPCRSAAPYVAAKRTQVTLMDPRKPYASLESGAAQLRLFEDVFDFGAFLDRELDMSSLVDRLRMLAFLIPDLEDEDFPQKKPILDFLIRRLKENLARAKEMPSTEIARLLTPLGKDYVPVFRVLNPAPLLLKHDKGLLAAIADGEITATYDLILERGTLAPIRKDIAHRLKRAGFREKVILNFYLAFVRHVSGEVYSFEPFQKVLEQAPEGELRETLRGISRRLSRHAVGHLRQALAHFHFGPEPGTPPFLPLEDGDEDDFPSAEGESEELDDIIRNSQMKADVLSRILEDPLMDPMPLIDMVEYMTDAMELRGESDRIIKMVRSELMRMPGMENLFDQLAQRLDPVLQAAGGMSREARTLLCGKSPGKKRVPGR